MKETIKLSKESTIEKKINQWARSMMKGDVEMKEKKRGDVTIECSSCFFDRFFRFLRCDEKAKKEKTLQIGKKRFFLFSRGFFVRNLFFFNHNFSFFNTFFSLQNKKHDGRQQGD